jgi:MinD-like ATPase involved in chromosome partitioning or flagellar assembly
MTIVCNAGERPPQEVIEILPAPVKFVATLDDAGKAVLRDRQEKLVLLGPAVAMAGVVPFATELTAEHPEVGLIVVREALDVREVQQAMRCGVRDVVERSDLRGLYEACARSLQLSNRTLAPLIATDAPPADGKVITVFSPKGGAGKTTISTNLSLALNDNGAARVCLVDLDLAFGDVAITLQLEPRVTIVDALDIGAPGPGDIPGLVTAYRPNHDCLLAPISPGDIERIPATLVTQLLGALSQLYDYVVVDTPSQLSEHVLSALDASGHHVLITTPELPSLKNLRLSLDVLDLLGYPPQTRSVVLNRADDSVGLTVAAVERVTKCALAVRVPASPDVPRSINRGVPIVADQPEHPVSAAVRRLAAENFAPALVPTAKHRGIAAAGRLRRRRSA